MSGAAMAHSIHRLDKLARSPVRWAALRVAKQLEAETGSTTIFKATAGDAGLWIEENGVIVALLIWRPWPSERTAWIGMAWTQPDLRRKGYYRALYAEMLAWARQAGWAKVGCGINARNTESVGVHTALGMTEEVRRFEVAL